MAGGALLGLAAGLGALLILLGFTTQPRTRPARASRLRRLIERSGIQRLSVGGLIGACGISAVVGGVMVIAISALPMAALLAAVIAAYVPILTVKRRAMKRDRQLRACWPDAIDGLGSAVRAGMSLPEALVDLGRRGPVPLRPAFETFAAEYRATGSFETALFVLRKSLADPVADRVIAAIGIARQVGGSDLGRVLTTLGDFLRDDARTRGEIEARQSWTVNAARVAVAAPWITLALLCTRPQTVQAYSTPTGAVILIASAGLSFIAYRLMVSLGRIPGDPRILR